MPSRVLLSSIVSAVEMLYDTSESQRERQILQGALQA